MRVDVIAGRVLSMLATFAVLAAGPAAGQETRPFLMSSTGVQAVPGEIQLYQNQPPGLPFSTLAADVDVITVLPEFLGVPFLSFAASDTPPPGDPWTVQMTAMANDAKASGKPLMLQLALARVAIVPLAINNNGTLQLLSGWAPPCADFSTPPFQAVGNAYLNYAAWMVRTFDPKYLVTMMEPNLYYDNCGGNTPGWRALVRITEATYDTAKRVKPDVIAFPTFNLEAIYGQSVSGFDQAHYDALAPFTRDRLGLATYPWFPGNPYMLPIDYLTRIRDRHPTEPRIVIAETGWNSDAISLYLGLFGICAQLFYSEPSFESAYLNLLIYSAYVGNFDVITWWSNRDMVKTGVLGTCYPPSAPPFFFECNGDPWCIAINFDRAFPPPFTPPEFGELVFKAFGSMGLRTFTGVPKPGQFDLWNRHFLLPKSP